MYKIVVSPSVEQNIDIYIKAWKKRFHDFRDEWDLGNSIDKMLGEETAGLMRENFWSKMESLTDTKNIKVYSIERGQVKQAVIPSHGIFLFLTYEEDEKKQIRYIRDIEILRK